MDPTCDWHFKASKYEINSNRAVHDIHCTASSSKSCSCCITHAIIKICFCERNLLKLVNRHAHLRTVCDTVYSTVSTLYMLIYCTLFCHFFPLLFSSLLSFVKINAVVLIPHNISWTNASIHLYLLLNDFDKSFSKLL